MDAARCSYYTSLFPLNPSGIVPSGPTAADVGLDTRDPGRGPRAALADVFYLRDSAAPPGGPAGAPATAAVGAPAAGGGGATPS